MGELLTKKRQCEILGLIHADKYVQALAEIRRLLRLLPNDAWLLDAMASSFYWEQDFRRAIKYSTRAVSAAPNEPQCLWTHGRILSKLGKCKDAIRYLEKLIKMGAVKAGAQSHMGTQWARELINDARVRIAECYLDSHNSETAMMHIKEHLRLRAQGVPSVFVRSDAVKLLMETKLGEQCRQIRALMDAQKYVEARGRIRQLLRCFPTDAYLLNEMALAYYEQRMYRRASRYSLKAVAIVPNDPLYLFNHAGILGMSGKVQDSIRLFEQIIRMGPARAGTVECTEGVRWARSLINDARFRVATFYLELGKRDNAKRYLLQHLRFRAEGVRSIYPRREPARLLKKLHHSGIEFKER